MFNDYNDTEWKLNITESLLELEVRQRAIMGVLITKGLTTAEILMSAAEEIKEQPHFKKLFDEIEQRREELKKTPSLEDLFKYLGMRGNENGDKTD